MHFFLSTPARWLVVFLLAATLAARGVLAENSWEQAPLGYSVELPRDHGSHGKQKVEWWYFTGNLRAEGAPATAKPQFGYQLTFFRIGVKTAADQQNPSAWAVKDLHMCHFAISDLETGKYHFTQRMDRAGPGLCGTAPAELHVWHGDWSARQGPGTDAAPIRLLAAEKGFSLDLTLVNRLAPLLHGEQGYSRKGSLPGNASIYYSLTRLVTSGQVKLGEQEYRVTGESWMDHEFGTSFLEPGTKGWDWFSLHLDDGSDLMLFQLRKGPDAEVAEAHAAGTLRKADGTVIKLGPKDFTLTPGRRWVSPSTKAEYPLEWQISLPGHGIILTTQTRLDGQEMKGNRGPSYWEGSISAAGTIGSAKTEQKLTGTGYLEMTGYGGPGMSQFFSTK